MALSWENTLYFYLTLAVSFAVLWTVQLKTQNANFVDAFWALGLFSISFILLVTESFDNRLRGFLCCFASGIWALRLSWHLFRTRVWSGETEDRRYSELRKKWGRRAQFNFFLLFQVQALLVLLCAIPFVSVAKNTTPFSLFDLLACVVATAAIFGEHVADEQLKVFKSKNDTNPMSICKNGFWKYSRHPNYFFEWIYWWTYVLFSVGSSSFVLSLVGPFLMLWLLWRVTGIAPSEKLSIEKRGNLYRAYQQETSAFFPWFPKRQRNAL